MFCQPQSRDPCLTLGTTWLEQQTSQNKSSEDEFKPFTVEMNGKTVEISMNMAKGDQMSIMIVVMEKLREWIECAGCMNGSPKEQFKPLRMTVRGAAGAGKSFFIKCLVNTVMKMFPGSRVAEVAGPTGASAYNVGGETMHRKWAINPHKPSQRPGKASLQRMQDRHKRTLLVLVDERSMLTVDVTGAAEGNMSVSSHGGSHDSEDWGGVPVVVFVGDDYQLPPPTNREKGAFDLMDKKTSFSQQRLGVASSGSQILNSMADFCMELTSVKRQNTSQSLFKELLNRLRVGESTNKDVDILMGLHLSRYSSADINKILNTGVVMHLFATKAPRDEFNFKRLSEVSSSCNPVALLKAKWSSSKRALGHSTIVGHFKSPPATATMLARGALVRIVDRNFKPEWGLYNNSIGIVEEMVFAPGDDPNKGDLPLYVVVTFEHYCGPIWDNQNPKVSQVTLHPLCLQF